MKLNQLIKTNRKKIRPGRGIGSGKGKTSGRGHKSEIDLKSLKSKKIINKKFTKLKILGTGEIKEKLMISANFFSKQAKSKIEKTGGKINILKK